MLFAAYANRVAQLSPEALGRIRERCAELNDPSFRALLDRALLFAKPFEPLLPEAAERSIPARVIVGVARAAISGLAIAGTMAAEFEASGPPAPPRPRREPKLTGRPRTDALLRAASLIEGVVAPLERTEPGVAVAVRAAGHAVLRHDQIPREDFEAIYKYVEPAIPFAELQASLTEDPT